MTDTPRSRPIDKGAKIHERRPRQTVTTGVDIHSRNPHDAAEQKGVVTHSKRGRGAGGAETSEA
jgi:hypothetical protein